MNLEKKDSKTIIYPSRIKYFFGSILLLFNLLLGLFFIISGFNNDLILIMFGIFFLIVLVPMSSYYIYMFIVYKPIIIVDQDGIYVNTLMALGYLKWSEINEIYTAKPSYGYKIHRKIPTLVIDFKIENQILDKIIRGGRFNFINKWLLKLNMYTVYIGQNLISIKIEELYEIVKKHVPNSEIKRIIKPYEK